MNFFAYTETWLSPDVFNSEFVPPHFLVFRHDRGGQGGGVLLAVKDHIPCSLTSSPDTLDIVTVAVGSSAIILCVLYHPPNASSDYDSSLSHYESLSLLLWQCHITRGF